MQVARSYDEGVRALVEGRVDFSRSGPASYVAATNLDPGLSIVASEAEQQRKIFNGVICVHGDSEIGKVEDLVGKRCAFSNESSTIGRYLARIHLAEHGVTAGDLGGYEATRRIRRMPEYADLPIIAMTANVMSRDKREALDAGTNDHIAKPIGPEVTFMTMARWISPSDGGAQTAQYGHLDDRRALDEPFLELPGIAIAGLIVTRNNTDLYRKLLIRFRDRQQNFVTDFRDARAGNDDHRSAAVFAHTLLGVAGNLGMKALRQAAASLEHACSEGHDRVGELMNDTAREL